MRIHGDYNSDEARSIQVKLNRCAGEGCADDYTITNYFRSLLIGVYANRIRFDAQKFGAEAIVQESEFMWNAISTQIQQEAVYKVSRTELQLQDLHIDLDEVTELVDSSAFKLEQVQMRPFEWSPATVMALSIEMRLDQLVISRETVTVMDVIADIGGFAVVLAVAASVLLHFLDQNHVSDMLATELFRVAALEPRKNDHGHVHEPLAGPTFCFSCCRKSRGRERKAQQLAR